MGILDLLHDEPAHEYSGREATQHFLDVNDIPLDDADPQNVRLYQEDIEDGTYRYELDYVEDINGLPHPRPRQTIEGSITDPVLLDDVTCEYCHDFFDSQHGLLTHQGMQHTEG